jgi:hypothetical protein
MGGDDKLDPVAAHLCDCLDQNQAQEAVRLAQKMAERNVETVQPLLRGNGTEQRFALLMLWLAAQHLLHVVSDCLASTGEMRENEKGLVCDG